MNDLERFLACMEYQPADRRPNHELGAWPQAIARWKAEAPDVAARFGWNWFVEEPAIGLDRREFRSGFVETRIETQRFGEFTTRRAHEFPFRGDEAKAIPALGSLGVCARPLRR